MCAILVANVGGGSGSSGSSEQTIVMRVVVIHAINIIVIMVHGWRRGVIISASR